MPCLRSISGGTVDSHGIELATAGPGDQGHGRSDPHEPGSDPGDANDGLNALGKSTNPTVRRVAQRKQPLNLRRMLQLDGLNKPEDSQDGALFPLN